MHYIKNQTVYLHAYIVEGSGMNGGMLHGVW